MISTMKFGLMAGASALVLGLALAPTSATAFEEVNWVWNAEVNETVTKTININLDGTPTGMLMLEDFQLSVGDVTATSVVSGVRNNQPGGGSEDGSFEVDLGILQFTGSYDPDSGNVTGTSTAPVPDGEQFLGGVVNPQDPHGITMNHDLGTITVDGSEASNREFDALTELPEVISEATAVANNTKISSSVMVELHEEQVVVGESGTGNNGEGNGRGDQATIAALSDVSDILNATVDSRATAVANNLSVDLVQESGTDGLLIADVSQTSHADVSAVSSVRDISINNYTGLGSIDRAIVSSVATAVGNNKSISVSGPSAPVVAE